MSDNLRYVGAKPRQNIPEADKDENWYKRNVMYYLGLFSGQANTAQRRLMERNYAIYSGNLDTAEFNYLLYPEGTVDPTLTVQAIFKNYQLAQPLIQSRINQFLGSKLSFSVDIVNREAVLKKEERKAAIMAEKIVKRIVAQMAQETGIEIPVEDQSLALPDDIKRIQQMPIREIAEDCILNGLHYCSSRYNYKEIYRKGLESLLLYNAVIFKNRRINNDPVPELQNPMDTAVFMKTDDDTIPWGDGTITVRWMSIPEILDSYEMDDEKINRLEQLVNAAPSELQQVLWNNGRGWYNGYGINDFYRNIGQDNAKVLVAEAEWRSISSFYIKKTKNQYSDDSYFYKKISEEQYAQLGKKEKQSYRKIKFTDLRQATLIGHNMIVSHGRVRFQTRREDLGYGRVPLQVCGVKKNPLMAVMTILAPLQIEYSIAWFHVERLLGQAGGKMIELWLHNKPSGWSNEKWIFYAKNKGINIREYKEGDELKPNPSMSQGVDLGMSGSMQYLVQYIMLIESTAQKLIGTNPAAQGFLTGAEAVGVTQANLVQAQNMAMGIYYDLSRAIEQQLNDAAAKMKMWWKGGETKVWQTEGELVSMTALEDLQNYDYGVFVQNNAIDEQRLMKYEALANQALASGGAEYIDFIMEMIDAENSAEAKAIVKRGMEAIRNRNMQIQQQQMQLQQASVQVQQQANEMKMQELQVKAQTPIQVAQINSETKMRIKEMEIQHDENKSEVENNYDNEKIAFEAVQNKNVGRQ